MTSHASAVNESPYVQFVLHAIGLLEHHDHSIIVTFLVTLAQLGHHRVDAVLRDARNGGHEKRPNLKSLIKKFFHENRASRQIRGGEHWPFDVIIEKT